MNNKKIDIDKYTKDLISKTELVNPEKDFTGNVMNRIVKGPSVKLNFFVQDDKRSNFWLVFSIISMLVAYFIFNVIKNDFSLNRGIEILNTDTYIKLFVDFFSRLWNELSLSPYILIALLGVLVLVILDKSIVKYLYSI